MSKEINPNILLKSCIVFFLIATTLAIYWQVSRHEFIKFDDYLYLIENLHVRSGLTLKGIKWAFTTAYAANWHPLTWLSHMLDVQLFGMKPAGHHLVNVFLHIVNTLLLFFLLCRTTGEIWRSAVVAALFALHPLHIESVAWASERKDLLSTLFGLFTLFIYTVYINKPGRALYGAMLVTFIMGLMSKPMLVTLPFVMLLMDYWPLNRFDLGNKFSDQRSQLQTVWRLIQEKGPFLLAVTASCILTYYAQQKGKAVTAFAASPLSERISNAFASYVGYIGKTLWPHDLSVFYPFNENISLWLPFFAFILLTAFTAIVIWKHQDYPYLVFGWFWYLLTLVPVIGIVRIGLQSMADRYTYLPLVGFFIMSVWWVSDMVNRVNLRFNPLPYLTAVLIAVCSITTWQQTSYWRTTRTLFTHSLKTTKDNYVAYYILGGEFEEEGRFDEALEYYIKATEIAPWYELARISRDNIMYHQGRLDAATLNYSEALKQNPDSVSGYINLGIIMALQNRFDDALQNFNRALELNPQSANAHYNTGMTLSKTGRFDDAIRHYRKVLEISPNNLNCLNNLGIALAELGKFDEAIASFSAALQIKPDFFDALNNLELARRKKDSHHQGTP